MLKNSFTNNYIEAGCDEAGRGCLAGPVFAAAVILPKDYRNKLLDDSKKLNIKTREKLRFEIEKDALAWAVDSYSPLEIDEVNILNASIYSMHRALKKLKIKPELLLIDGNRFKQYQNIPFHCIVKGDGKYLSIAAASILAKTHRDEYMLDAHLHHPVYHWNTNKGYPTLQHKLAIQEYGITDYHRKTFNYNLQLKLDF
ncbi:MAG: ribonuclease HII [Bacteroidetes bacterium]|jgi:ribonuclease HII|nr:ribonuclease HII [Bacteroidota bacterium]MAE09475.1 ribonuclease HII [Bacteroidota bacterium]|tara:strand:- start:487 stop:1083 length:597 start_codon:yes stop_codon:yes gene_type:complete